MNSNELVRVPWPRRLVVLMYRAIDGNPDPSVHDPRYRITPYEFEQQMWQLRRHYGRAWLPDWSVEGAARNREAMITFDDASASDVEQALPCLLALRLRAVFFVTPELLGGTARVSIPQLRDLAAAGMAIGAHAATHRFCTALTAEEQRQELVRCRDGLQQALGLPVDLVALPGGRDGAREARAARAAGFRHLFDSRPGDNRMHKDSDYVQRIPIARGLRGDEFAQILAWRGPTVRRLRWRHRFELLSNTLIGGSTFHRLREALAG